MSSCYRVVLASQKNKREIVNFQRKKKCMKKIVFSLAILLLLTACGGGESKKEKQLEKETTTDLSKDPVYKKGLALVAKSDCLTCHKVDEPLTGPTYRDVANKYAGMPDTIVSYLADKIIAGGKGNWGETYMTPHSALPKEDAEAMVKYILLLKK